MDSDEDSYDSEGNEISKPRLNMKHGFIHHIRRNQIDRDNYDKKLKATPKSNRHHRQSSQRKPEPKLYVPPKHSDNFSTERPSEPVQSGSVGKPLFKLEYATNDGNVHELLVKQGQDAKKLAKRFVNQAGIPVDLLETLEWKINQEQIKRS